MDWLKLFIVKDLLGYFLQCTCCLVGICSVAKKRVQWLSLLITSAMFALIVYLIKESGMFSFGVHTMLIILIENLICIVMFKIEIRHTILGSLMVTAIVLAGELIDYTLLMPFFDKVQIDELMKQPLSKAWIAVPGNILFSVIVIIAYIKRVIKGKKSYGEAG